MKRLRTIVRLVLIVYVLALHAAVVYLLLELQDLPDTASNSKEENVALPTPITPTPIASATVSIDIKQSPADVPPVGVVVPVLGVKPDDLISTYDQQRGEGRSHGALDIPAALGTPVVAAADGAIAMHHDSERGGITIYQLSADRQWVFYYAHLQRRAETAKEGALVKRSEVIGYVGDTGNAGVGNYHLHFAIWRVTDPKRIWEGENIDPYPILRFGSSLPP